jgi:hypothetical protein
MNILLYQSIEQIAAAAETFLVTSPSGLMITYYCLQSSEVLQVVTKFCSFQDRLRVYVSKWGLLFDERKGWFF